MLMYKLTKLYKLVPYRRYTKFITTGENSMNNKMFTGLACVGLFSNLFVALSGKNLDPSYASLFTNIGSVAIASALVFYFLSQKTEAEKENERDEVRRDFDAVYRHIDDTARDLRDDIRDCASICSRNDKCCVKK